MRVTVGAIRAIVRQEAGRLDETAADTAGNQMIFKLMRGEEVEQLQGAKSGQVRNRVVRLIDRLTDLLAAEQLPTSLVVRLENLVGLDAPPEEAGEAAEDEGSSKSSGYAAGKASDPDLDESETRVRVGCPSDLPLPTKAGAASKANEGSAQTSGYSDGKGSDPGARGN